MLTLAGQKKRLIELKEEIEIGPGSGPAHDLATWRVEQCQVQIDKLQAAAKEKKDADKKLSSEDST